MSSASLETEKVSQRRYTVAEFLESAPPGTVCEIGDLISKTYRELASWDMIRCSDLTLHCEKCEGLRVYRCLEPDVFDVPQKAFCDCFLTYRCSNCQSDTKTFALAAKRAGLGANGWLYKFGELPAFGPPTPARLVKLLGPDREEFFKGRRCETQGLGVGAFIYYRRVVENQKNRIFEEVKKVSQKIGAGDGALETLDRAITETQFSRALEIAKEAIPESLLVNGQNPLGLLHSALSEGVHGLGDQECLELAQSVRVILTELSDRLGQALKEEAELVKALDKLVNRKARR